MTMWGFRSWEKILQPIHLVLGSLLYVHENSECIQMLEGKQREILSIMQEQLHNINLF